MSAKQSLALLCAITCLVLSSLAALAWRLNPCLAMGTVCFSSSVGRICRLLLVVGVAGGTPVLGALVLGATVLLPIIGLLAVADRGYRTASYVRSLHSRLVQPLPGKVTVAAGATGLTGKFDLVDTPQPLAFAYGCVRPRVCLSTGLLDRLDPSELRAVLGHERVHVDHRDPLRALVAHGMTTMLFWLPVARDLYLHLQVAGEVEADAVVARRPGGRVALAGALGKLLTATAVGPETSYAISGLTATDRRIDALLEGKSRAPFAFSGWGAAASIVLVLPLICLLLL